MAKVRAVVFDFDGVIVESLDVKTEAFKLLFADHPEHVDRVVRLHTENMGVSRYEKFRTIYRDFLDKPLDDAEMARLDERFSELVFERVVSCEFVAGAPELVERLAADHELYVASATPEAELRRIVEARGLAGFFNSVHGSPRTKSEIVGEILETRGLEPEEVVFVGDAMTDLLAARESGVGFVGRVPRSAPDPFSELDIVKVADLAELGSRWDELRAAPPPSP
jgi:HAD superfamily hydrolase (TIGR01549 family)